LTVPSIARRRSPARAPRAAAKATRPPLGAKGARGFYAAAYRLRQAGRRDGVGLSFWGPIGRGLDKGGGWALVRKAATCRFPGGGMSSGSTGWRVGMADSARVRAETRTPSSFIFLSCARGEENRQPAAFRRRASRYGGTRWRTCACGLRPHDLEPGRRPGVLACQ